MYSPLVTDEAERSDVWFEVPDHDSAVSRAADYLAQVGVEPGGQDALLVSLERAFEGWFVK